MEAIVQNSIALLESSLPNQFPFYHLGHVEIAPELPDTDDFVGQANLTSSDLGPVIAYSFEGDLRALLIITLEQGHDLSAYTEVGNILASQMATRLSDENGLDVMISPPRSLTRAQAANLRQNAGPAALKRTYLHTHKGTVVPIQAVILPVIGEGKGNV